jgi:hypothetical protein
MGKKISGGVGRWLAVGLVLVGLGAGGVLLAAVLGNSKHDSTPSTMQPHSYSLNFKSSLTFKAGEPTQLAFVVRDEKNQVLKDFDVVHEKLLHLIVVRKDRAYFQHIHPTFDKTTGIFTAKDFVFPTDGEYRIFADFTPSNVPKDAMGMKSPSTPFYDVKVGSGSYTPQALGGDKLTSDVNGLSTTLEYMNGDSAIKTPYTNRPLTLGVSFQKNGAAYKSLQPYLGALGHMVVLGPNLEYIHAHPLDESTGSQTGTIAFAVTFPGQGQYKLYLQTQAEGVVNTTDYNFTVQANPNDNHDTMNTEGMGH